MDTTRSYRGLEGLPQDVIVRSLLPLLRARSLHALSMASVGLFSTAHACAPGMKLELYAHQKRSVAWMRYVRERGDRGRGAEREPMLRGGILADDPGLGKTITITYHLVWVFQAGQSTLTLQVT